MSALRTGIRYTRHNRLLRATLARAVAFFVFASAYWALLPLVAREQIAGGPELYGILLGAIGAGAIGGAFFWPRVRSKLGTDHLVAVGTIGTALALALYGFARDAVTGATASIIAGVCWIAVLSSLNVSAQFALPEWVRRRGLAVYVTVMFGAMTIGSAFWGQIARMAGLPIAHLLAAASAVVAIPLTRRWKLHSGATIDLAPSMHWPAPVVAGEIENDQGPVLVTIEYHVAERNRGALLAALDKVEHERRRDGAYAWQVFEDTAETGRFLETFLVESWVEHLRQHERVTNADRVLQEHVHRLLELPPKVTHLISAEAASQRHDRVPSASPSQL
jgi:branched-subunit amino acid transport protein